MKCSPCHWRAKWYHPHIASRSRISRTILLGRNLCFIVHYGKREAGHDALALVQPCRWACCLRRECRRFRLDFGRMVVSYDEVRHCARTPCRPSKGRRTPQRHTWQGRKLTSCRRTFRFLHCFREFWKSVPLINRYWLRLYRGGVRVMLQRGRRLPHFIIHPSSPSAQ